MSDKLNYQSKDKHPVIACLYPQQVIDALREVGGDGRVIDVVDGISVVEIYSREEASEIASRTERS